MKKKLLNFIDHKRTEKFFLFVIFLELILCMLDPDSVKYAGFKQFVNYFEFLVIGMFSIELLIRFFAAEKPKQMVRPFIVVDMLTLLPVTGLLFIAAVLCSSIFACFVENISFPIVFKNMPPSSFWSIPMFFIYTYIDPLPMTTFIKFVSTLTPSINLFAGVALIALVLYMTADVCQKQIKAINVRKVTLRVEPG